MRSGLVLAGGRSSRFGGEEKSLKVVGGKRMICRVIDALRPVTDELVVSARDAGQRDLLIPFIGDLGVVYDRVRGIGPISGLLAGLERLEGEYVVVVACDMPLISPAAVRLLFEMAAGHDAAVPRHESGYIEPLHAVYRRAPMLEAVRESVAAGERNLSAPVGRLKDVVFVPDGAMRAVDPGLDTFLNVNRAEDLELVSREKPSGQDDTKA